MKYWRLFILLFSFTIVQSCSNSATDAQQEQQDITTDQEKEASVLEAVAKSTSKGDIAEAPNHQEILEDHKQAAAEPKVVKTSQKITVPKQTESATATKDVATKTPKTTVEATSAAAPPALEDEASPQIEEEKVTTTVIAEQEAIVEEPQVTTADHSKWDALLRKNVNASGKVNYAGFKAEQSKLDAYLQELASHPIQEDWSRNEEMAYWINVYNAFTVKLIVDNYPINSITQLHGGKPWDVKWIKLGDKTYSLNQVENDILRPTYKDARIHFAVNCAAKSCPPLLNRAWTAANLNSYLQRQTKAFIANTDFNILSADKVKVSKIFEWYGSDFGNLIGFLNKYSENSISDDAQISFMEYDWALNN